MQPTKIKTTILTATGLIEHTTEFRVEGQKYVADLADGTGWRFTKKMGCGSCVPNLMACC